ncbi:MAG: hypothetical protein MJZ89_04455 [Paludibacteraceae bacterium]|nr:hypothetical protein [Paludibacteraceae bacterium]
MKTYISAELRVIELNANIIATSNEAQLSLGDAYGSGTHSARVGGRNDFDFDDEYEDF